MWTATCSKKPKTITFIFDKYYTKRSKETVSKNNKTRQWNERETLFSSVVMDRVTIALWLVFFASKGGAASRFLDWKTMTVLVAILSVTTHSLVDSPTHCEPLFTGRLFISKWSAYIDGWEVFFTIEFTHSRTVSLSLSLPGISHYESWSVTFATRQT